MKKACITHVTALVNGIVIRRDHAYIPAVTDSYVCGDSISVRYVQPKSEKWLRNFLRYRRRYARNVKEP